MVASIKGLVNRIQNYMCVGDPTVDKAAQRFRVPVGFVERCMETDDLAVLQRHYASFQSSKPKIKTAGEKKDKPAETNGYTPQLDYQGPQLPALPPSESVEKTLETTVTASLTPPNLATVVDSPTDHNHAATTSVPYAPPVSDTVSPETTSQTSFVPAPSAERTPYQPKYMTSVPLTRKAQPPQPHKAQHLNSSLLEVIGDVNQNIFLVDIVSKMTILYTRLQAGLILLQNQHYSPIITISEKSHAEISPEEVQETALEVLRILATSLKKHLQAYEAVTTHPDLSDHTRELYRRIHEHLEDRLQAMQLISHHVLEEIEEVAEEKTLAN